MYKNNRVPKYPALNFPKVNILHKHSTITETRKLSLIQCCELIYMPYLNFTSFPNKFFLGPQLFLNVLINYQHF